MGIMRRLCGDVMRGLSEADAMMPSYIACERSRLLQLKGLRILRHAFSGCHSHSAAAGRNALPQAEAFKSQGSFGFRDV